VYGRLFLLDESATICWLNNVLCAAGFFIYDENEDAVNMATMPAQQQQQQLVHAMRPASGRPAAKTARVSTVHVHADCL
jgi:hypothetical protein